MVQTVSNWTAIDVQYVNAPINQWKTVLLLANPTWHSCHLTIVYVDVLILVKQFATSNVHWDTRKTSMAAIYASASWKDRVLTRHVVNLERKGLFNCRATHVTNVFVLMAVNIVH